MTVEREPALPPNPALLNRQPAWFKPVFYGCIVASVLFVLAGLTAPHVIRSKKKPDQTEAINYLRQLFAADITQSEQMFYAKIKNTRKPDGDIRPGQALKKGEVGFAYISGLSTKGNPARTIAFAPIIPGTTKFDPKPFEGKAVALRIDNSVTSFKINKDGHIYDQGVNLLSPAHPIWDGKPLKIHYPDL